MMHHGLDHYRVFKHQHGTDQIVGTFGDVLESPQVDSILVACFADSNSASLILRSSMRRRA
jgi:hypothetical protein